MRKHLNAMISSTMRDLPEYRKHALDACLRMNVFPIMMEHLPAVASDAIDASLQMVESADIYIGIIAHRYGYVPIDARNSGRTSITEMEYERAVTKNKPCLIFLIDNEYPLESFNIEKGDGALKLLEFKKRLLKDNIVKFFTSPEDLRGQIIHSLVSHRITDAHNLHSKYSGIVPSRPEPYIAHPYTLIQTSQLVGREYELDLLSDWAKGPQSSVFKIIVAMGGVGKSALTWTWFNEIAPKIMSPLAGRVWWSFYESDASFDNFVTRTLAYASERPLNEVEQLSVRDREAQLIALLNREPFLIVLDGLERILVAYSRMDASRLSDEDLGKKVAISKHQLRKTIDRQVGAMLLKLSQVSKSRILATTRLYPTELQNPAGKPVQGVSTTFLGGLTDEAALKLWYTVGNRGSRDLLLPIFNTFDNHPLLLRALAGEVAEYRRNPGNFEQWRRDNPDFDPFSLQATQTKSHVLAFALSGLNTKSQKVLKIIAAFRMPATYDTIVSLTVGQQDHDISDEEQLDAILRDLEDRGLMGWDRQANRYDLHPIVRGIVWRKVASEEKELIYQELHDYFSAFPLPNKVKTLEDLTPTIELYNSLIGLRKYSEAWAIYNDRVRHFIYYQLGNYHTDLELLKELPRAPNGKPLLSSTVQQVWSLLYEAMCYERIGNPVLGIERAKLAIKINRENGKQPDLASSLLSFSMMSCDVGNLKVASEATKEAITIINIFGDANWQGIAHRSYSRVLMLCGDTNGAKREFNETQKAYTPSERFIHGRSILLSRRARLALYEGDPATSYAYAYKAFKLSQYGNLSRENVFAQMLIGVSLLSLATQALDRETLTRSQQFLHRALENCKKISLIEVEAEILASLAKWYLYTDDLHSARNLGTEALQIAYECNYRIRQTDVLNLLAKIELTVGNVSEAVDYATKAYKLAWCDGPPYTYHWGLETAKATLSVL